MDSLGFLIFLVGIYFLPWIIAAARKHHNRGAICALNVFLGWTFLGWVVALVWAFTNPASGSNTEKKSWGGRVETTRYSDSEPVRSEVVDEIERLVRLKKAGEISEEEFSRAKQKALQR